MDECMNGDGKPVHCKDLCQACYRRAQRQERGLKKPGPKPDPSRPFSRHSESSLSHHATARTPMHACGTPFEEGVYYPYGKRRCLHCDPIQTELTCDRRHPRSEYAYERPATPFTPGCRRCDAENAQSSRMFVKYGLTQDDIAGRLERQDYKCAICHQDFESPGRRPEVDHDHNHCRGQKTCGKCVRDIICQPCNRMLGGAQDDVVALQGGIDYVKKWKRSYSLSA